MIDVRNHMPFVEALLSRYGIPQHALDVVIDVYTWCQENQVPEANPFCAAKCFYKPEQCYIVITAVQTDDMIAGANSLMLKNGFEKEARTLDTGLKYLKHLLLHEIAAFKLQTSDQAVRDGWAFTEMAKNAA